MEDEISNEVTSNYSKEEIIFNYLKFEEITEEKEQNEEKDEEKGIRIDLEDKALTCWHEIQDYCYNNSIFIADKMTFYDFYRLFYH